MMAVWSRVRPFAAVLGVALLVVLAIALVLWACPPMPGAGGPTGTP